MKLATLTAPQSDFDHEEKGDALYAMEIALAMERLNLQVKFPPNLVQMLSIAVPPMPTKSQIAVSCLKTAWLLKTST